MTRHALVRGAIAAAMGIALCTAGHPPAAAEVPSPQEVVVPTAFRDQARTATLSYQSSAANGVGARGVFHTEDGLTGRQWTRYEDGTTVPAPVSGVLAHPTGSDAQAVVNGREVELRDASDGSVRKLTMPDGLSYQSTFGSTVVAAETTTDSSGTYPTRYHLLTLDADGATRDAVVTGLPESGTLGSPLAGDAAGVVFSGRVDGRIRVVLVDPATGRVSGTSAPLPDERHDAVISDKYVAVHGYGASEVLVLARDHFSAPPTAADLSPAKLNPASTQVAVVGDWLVYQNALGSPLLAKPIAGGPPVTLAQATRGPVGQGPGGTAAFIGGMYPTDWGIRRITADVEGKPQVALVKELPQLRARVEGLALAQGRLAFIDDLKGSKWDYTRMLSASGTPTYGERTRLTTADTSVSTCAPDDAACGALHGTGDGRFARLSPASAERERVVVNGPASYSYSYFSVPEGGEITSVTRDHLIHTSKKTGQQTVRRLGDGHILVQRDAGAAAVWAGRLWTPGAAKGVVTARDLAAGTTVETADTGAGCVPEELQAVGRWLYWSCPSGGPAGVYDRTGKKSVPVPSGEALLGDGWVVTHDKAAGKLLLTAVDTGQARSRTVGDLLDTGVSQRHVRWTVDRFAGNAAYVDGDERVHLVPSGVPGQPMATAGAPDNSTKVTARTFDAVPEIVTVTPLSKPAVSWTLTLRDKVTGRTVDTVRGGAARERLEARWHGMVPGAQGDAAFPNGTYAWTLSVLPADGNGPALRRTGTIELRGASPVRHDFLGDDTVGDLLTLNFHGSFTFHRGTGSGKFSGKTSATGWPTSAYAVPFGDVNGDRCNDVLVRSASGELRAYKPKCGKALTVSTASSSLGSGWGQYDVLTSPGDMNGDRRPDLVARQASTGDMYFFAGTAGGRLAAKVKAGSNWKTYGRITGVGDITGDGRADLLAHDRSGGLWRYEGTGDGRFKGRVQVFKDWGRSYNALVGVGDVSGDGRADIVVRDSAGKLFRNDGNGRGSFGGRTQIATGWQGYKGLF
ncbi:FG-GAP repeat domain-containing protein [Streptomyces chryseus]